MFLIAQRFGVSLNALIAANPHISNPAVIFPGDVLCVPGAAGECGNRSPASCPAGFQGRYTVRAGDTMFLIAQRFGVSLNALIAANPHISNPNVICPGDVLCVPGAPDACGSRVPASCPAGFQGRYTVRAGDTMFLIAQRFGVSLNALIAANPHISNPNVICPAMSFACPAPPVHAAVGRRPAVRQVSRAATLSGRGHHVPDRPAVWRQSERLDCRQSPHQQSECDLSGRCPLRTRSGGAKFGG